MCIRIFVPKSLSMPFFNFNMTGGSTTMVSGCVTPPMAIGGYCRNAMQLFLIAVISMLASCGQNNVKKDDSLKKYFDENQVTGCFGILDNGTGNFTVYNLSRYRDSAYLPASTFKIVNALIGLQTGKITSDSMIIKWDGIQRPVAAWNHDLNMYQAFRVSAVPYFQEVARRIGKDTMQFWLDSLHYGSGKKDTAFKITTAIDTFWLDNTLKITPDENLGLVKKLYFNELPFFKLYQQKVKNAMLMEENANYSLAYKTGLARTKKDHPLGWVTGWIEENRHPYFFVLNIESDDPQADIASARLKILKTILQELGFFKGSM